MKLSAVDIRIFAAIADLGGITAAARRLGLTKSLVSRELATMESRLGTRLLQRTTRRVSLTETGELLATYARRVVEELDNAEAALEATRDQPRGDLAVSAPFSIIRFLLAPKLGDFHARFPDVRVALDVSTRVIDLIEEGVDVAIRTGPLAPSSLIARKLGDVAQILVATPEYLARHGEPAGVGDLVDHSIIALRRDLEREKWPTGGVDGDRGTIAIAPKFATPDPGILMDLAVHGLGIGVVPQFYVRDALSRGDLVRVLPTYRRALVPIHAVYPSRRMLAPKVRVFVDFAADVIESAI